MKKILLVLASIMSILFIVSCGNEEQVSQENQKVVKYNLEQNPPQLDAQLATDEKSGIVLGHTFEGLTEIGTDGKALPGVAESWTTEGNTWTFKLRKTAKWHNGDPVVAGDFVAAWERALNPASASEYAFIMYNIKGAEEYNSGKIKDFAEVGVKAVDDYTLKVDLKEPVTYFDSLVAFHTFLPQNQKFYKEHKDSYATSVEDFMGNGPYKMVEWDFENKIILEKSENYWNKDNVKIDRIEMPIIVDFTASLKAYQNGELDWTVLPNEEIVNYKDNPEVVEMKEARVIYLLLNNKNKLFSNAKVRRAVSMAIDRKALVDKIKNGAGSPAESMVPEIIPGKKGMFREDYPQSAYGIGYNPTEAKKLFEEGLKEVGLTIATLPQLTMYSSNDDTSTKEAQFYQEQFKKNLGMDIKLEPVTFQIRLQHQTAKDYDLILAGWGADYNDPMTFLDMWMSNSGQNNSNWANPKYDELIVKAKAEANAEVRMDILAQAEKLLMDEMAIVPTFFRNKKALAKPRVKGIQVNAFSPVVYFGHADVQE
jgi:oligopeptide transport system substrate-binding protein